ncbi:hypothetical protein HPULCUR_008337 [Helicostylum pulchrum]|uniref:Arrestin C-terminal-like domain-containing protein n=1 Tax=Helicostylum pulchrum TaxID=562976 RepID=A0ABP9Y7B2_9FUNG
METEYPQSPHIEKHNVVMEKTMVPFVKPESTISVVTGKNGTPISIDLEHSQSYFYLPGEVIHGIVTIGHPNTCKGKVDIQLSCTYRVPPSYKRSIFKVMIDPIWISDDINQSPFSLTIPSDLPTYNNNDKSIVGRIEYKLKATYEMVDLPLSLYPKTSIPIFISAQISTSDPLYTIPLQSKKDITITIPRDVVLKNNRLRKGEKGLVSAKLTLHTSCFLPGQSLPFTLEIQHMAPVKQLQGIQMVLERTTRIQKQQGDSLETTIIAKNILPLVCDLDDFSVCISDQVLQIPEHISPTSCNVRQDIIMPFYIQYKLKVLVNMDMHHFLEDIPLRKRDRAFGMMTKIIGSLEQDGPAFFYGTTIELDLPITIGTTTSSTCYENNQQLKLPTTVVASPVNYHSSSPIPRQNNINRLDSDPTHNRSSNRLQMQRHQFISTSSFFSQPVIDRPPSAPPLDDLHKEDHISPPPYLA